MKKVVTIQEISSISSKDKGNLTIEENNLNDEFYLKNYKTLKLKYQQREQRKEGKEREEVILKSSLKKPKTPGLGIRGMVHLSPLHVNDINNVSDIIHRVTLQSGLSSFCSSF